MQKPHKPKPLTKRLCRACQKPLPKEYYFRHKECQGLHQEDYHDLSAETELHLRKAS